MGISSSLEYDRLCIHTAKSLLLSNFFKGPKGVVFYVSRIRRNYGWMALHSNNANFATPLAL